MLENLRGKRLLLAGIALAALYWVLESFLDAFVFGSTPLVDQLLLFPTGEFGRELWVRLSAMSFLIAFGAILQVLHNRRQRDLSESEERYRTIVDTASEAVITASSDGLIRSFNPGAEHSFGYGAGEVLGRPLGELMPEHFREAHRRGLNRYLETGEPRVIGSTVELAGLRKDGTEFPIELSLNEMSEGGERVFVGIIRDITERKQAEEKLRESEERSSALVSAVPDLMFRVSPEGEYLDFQSNQDHLLYVPKEEILGRKVHDVLPSGLADRCVQGIGRALRTGETQVLEYQFPMPTGVLDFELRLISSGPEEVLGLVRDVTERERRERELREAEERFRSAFDHATIGMALTEPHTTSYMKVNQTICRLLGRSEEELLAMSARDVTHPGDLEDTLGYAQRALDGELDSYEFEKRYTHADGHTVWASTGVSLVRDSEGEPLYFVVQMQDITGRKRAEREVRELNESLERRIQERTAELRETLGRHERSLARERMLKEASAALVAAPDRESIYAAALEAIRPFVEEAPGTRVSIWSGSADRDLCVGASGDSAEEIRGEETYIRDFPDRVRLPLLEGRPVELQPGETADFQDAFAFKTKLGAFFMVPLILHGQFGGRVVVASDSSLSGEIQHALETLGSQVALALERADLVDDLVKRRGEERFRSLIQNSSDIIVVLDGSGTVTYASPSVGRVLGREPGDFVGDGLPGFVHPDDLVPVQSFLADALSEPGTISSTEFRMQHADGSWRHIEANCNNLLDDPTVGGVVINARDITERKAAERAVRQLASIVESSEDAIISNALDGTIASWNPGAERLFGYSSEEVIGRHVSLLAPEERSGESREAIERLRRGESTQSYETVRLDSDGRPIDVSVLVSPLKDGSGTVTGVAAIMRDITERKRTEESLRQSEERFRAFFEQSAVGISIATPDRVLQRANLAYEEMTGYSEEELAGRPVAELSHPDDVPADEELNQRLSAGELERYRREKRYVRKDGTVIWVRPSVSAVRDEDGEVLFLIGMVEDITERKRAEEAVRELNEELEQRIEERTAELRETLGNLRTSEERYRLVAEGSNDGIWEWMPRTGEAFWNDRLLEIVGLSREEVTVDFDLFADLLHPDDRQRMLDAAQAHLERGTPYEEEFRLRHASAGYRDCFGRGKAQWDEDGNPRRMAGTVTDITERVQAEEALRESEARSRSLSEAAFDAFSINSGGVVHETNKGFADLFGYEPSEVIGMNITEFVTPEMRELTARRASLGAEEMYETVGLRKDGTTLDLEIQARHSTYKGSPARVSALRDITERKRAEREIRARAAQQAAAAELGRLALEGGDLPELMDRAVEVLCDELEVDLCKVLELLPDGETLLLRSGVGWEAGLVGTATVGTGPDSQAGYTLLSEGPVVVEDLRSETRFSGPPLLHEHGVVSGLSVVIRVRGLPFGVLGAHTTSERAFTGDDVRFLEVAANTLATAIDRRRAEEEIQELNEGLERRVEERTEQLESTVAELEQARANADAANQAKSEFLANTSHEIRTPMNGVIGMTELLLDTELDGEQREYARTVQSSAEGLLSIINDILDFSKIEAGKLLVETVDFDLRAVVEEVANTFAGRAHSRGLELASFVEPGVPAGLRGDPGRLRQVLTNLVGNAVKFTEEGEVVVLVETVEEAPGTSVLRFEVRDTGIGLSPEQQGRLFQSFSQADASTTRRYGGTGLGLAISRQLLGLMGGEIGVQSEAGKGSTFWFTVPLERQPETAESGPVKAAADLRGLRVLVVDDRETNRRILLKQTGSWGMRSASAESGAQALEELRAAAGRGEPYDLAILDMQMPEMDGLELARRVKSDPALSPTRLVLLTSMGNRGGSEVSRAGIEAHLTKPVRQSDLYDALAALMGHEEVRTEETATRSPRGEAQGSGPRLLLAEDNPVNQKIAVRMLERLGYRVDVAATGREAVEAVERGSYAAVLMDVQMPEMDGYEATAGIRHREGTRHTPIIAMTANAMAGDREEALDAGMDDYIAKPVKSETLEATLNRWLGQGEESPSGEGVPTAAPEIVQEQYDPVLDEEALDDLRDLGGPELLGELAGTFLEEADSRVTALREAVETGDAAEVERATHALKGSCGNMGVRRMSAAAARLQEMAVSGDLSEEAAGRLAELETELERARPALLGLWGTGAGG